MKDNRATWETEDPSPKARCGRASRIFYNGTMAIVERFYCGRWDCPRCASFKRKQWKEKILQYTNLELTCREEVDGRVIKSKLVRWEIAEARGDPRGYWHREIGAEDYEKTYKQIQRAEAKYFAIVNDGHISILVTKPLSPEDKFLGGKELEEHLDRCLAQEKQPLNGNHKVRCSQAFSGDDKQREGGWQVVTVAEDVREVAENFEQWGCKVSWKNGENEFFVGELTERAQQAMKGLFLLSSSPWDMGVRCPLSVLW